MRRERSVVFLLACALFLLTACGSGGGGGGGLNPQTPVNVAFVTSSTGTADLSTWALSGGQAGLAGADAVCAASAAMAGIDGTFVAWLSDDTSDALCRVSGLSGTVATDCNGELDAAHPAGPWVRTDGRPFAGTMDKLLANGPLMPMRFNEYGDEVDVDTTGLYFTATSHIDGSLAGGSGNCRNWSSTAGSVQIGDEDSTGFRWTGYGKHGCGNTDRLLCMQTGSQGSLPKVSHSGKKVFVTNSVGSGNTSTWPGTTLTSIEAADEACQTAASDAGLSQADNFKAWISSSTVNAADRIISNGPWVRMDGFKVADNTADLLDGTLYTSINVTEYGTYDNGYTGGYAWTGTDGAGQLAPSEACSDWTVGTNGASGRLGDIASAGGSLATAYWTRGNVSTCDISYHLYCFEDSP